MTALNTARRNFVLHWKLLTLSAAALIAIGIAYSAWVYSAAADVEALLDEADVLDIAGIASGDDGALVAAVELVDQTDNAIGSLSSRLGPARMAASVFGWIPWAGDQLQAPGLLANRAEADLNAVRPMISTADDLFVLYSLVTTGDFTSDDSSEEFDQLIKSLELRATETSLAIAEVRVAAARMDDLSLLSMFNSRAQRATELENKLVRYGNLLVASPSTVYSARSVAMAVKDAIAKLGATSGTSDFSSISQAMERLATESNISADSLDELNLLVQEAIPGSEFALLVSDMATAMNSVADLSAGLWTITESLNMAMEILKESDGPLLSSGDVLPRALQLLSENSESLTSATDRVTVAIKQLNVLIGSGRAEFFPEEVNDSLIEQTSSLLDIGTLMRQAPVLLLDMIGTNSAKTYLVLGQTSDELRAAGGFTSSAWTLTFIDGNLASSEYIPILEFDNATITHQTPPPPQEQLQYYMDAGALFLRDVGWSPDFPEVGHLAADLFSANRGSEVDGVLAITQWGIIRLVEAIGGLEVDGEFITPDKTLELIEDRTDTEGTGFLEHLFVGLLDSLRSDADVATQLELVRAIKKITDHKDLMFYSEHASEQARLESLEWAGIFPVDHRDRLGLIDSNVGWSKSDRSIERGANYKVDLSDPQKPVGELTAHYNHTGNSTGRACDSHSPPPAEYGTYVVSRNSCYWNYVRAYVAIGSEPLQHSLLPLPDNSVPDQLGLQEPGTSTFSHGFDESGDHFAGLLNVSPGQQYEFSVSYQLPSSLIQWTDTGLIYELNLIAQSGALGRSVSVIVQLPEGHVPEEFSHEPSAINRNTVTFEFDLLTDQLLTVETALR